VSGPREAVEQAILVSVGLAALTKERIEGIVSDLVARGTLSAEDGAAVASRLFARIRGEGPPAHAGILGRLEDGAKAAFREMGLATKTDFEDMRLRLAELERRLALLEAELPPG
jgi:polyhydroxyalkanoate synthesis regulator phasin